ncbi:MAG TPA: CARDB domain-containing protein [Chthoniobacterales bacterium]|nr:CARDB domain-containing protein [Chthoniobacterales bacterium]
MKKNPTSQSGLLNLRALSALALCSIGIMLGALSFASSPDHGTLDPVNGPTTTSYTAGPFFVANPTPVIEVDSGPECFNPFQPCDDYTLTVSLPPGYTGPTGAHPNASVKVTLSWTDNGSGASDYDLYIYKTPRTDCNPQDCTETTGGEAANYQSASSNNPEVATIFPLQDGSQTYTIVVVPYTPSGETVNVTAELVPGPSGGGVPGFGGPDPTTPGVPRYQNFYAPSGSSAESSQGEFNIGFNPKSGRIMTMNLGPIWRITPPELLTPVKPECCEGLWEDVTNPSTITGVDPILFTDQKTGRTFASNSTAGANALYGFSDNDGDLWVPLAASPASGGTDHETIGSGPYPASLSALSTPANQGEAVYYCSQTFPLGPATCQRSDTLGASYGPGVFAYYGNGLTKCHGLHGHVHVAPDGTVWLPVNQCGGQQGGAFSTDGGVTWHEFLVPNSKSQAQGADPSIAIDSNSQIYYAYVNNQPVPTGSPLEGHARVAVGTLNKSTNTIAWTSDIDIGASHGIVNAAEIEAAGGTAGRAAVGFLGTDRAGDYQAIGFPGSWYAFIASTYDNGQHWVTVNATPNDPVQRATGIWQQGGSHEDRNLLDFNEITVDSKGRALYGYSDGCVSDGCIGGTAANDFVAFMRVARQSGGKPLFASFDSTEPTLPKPPCLSGIRFANVSHLTWKAPDNGGSDILYYEIWRGTASGAETLLAQTGSAAFPSDKTSYDDITVDPSVVRYYYFVKAINGIGTGPQSNEINLPVTPQPPPETPCTPPGLTKLTDAQGDTQALIGVTSPAPPGADLKSFQLAQPYAADNVIRLVFTINTWDNGQSPQPVGSSWYVAMKIPDSPGATTFHYKAVHMTWNGTTPTFESYTPGPNSGGGVDGRFVVSGSQKPAEAGQYEPPFNKIVIVVKASDLGLNPGDTIAGFVSGVSQTVGGFVTGLWDQMPESLAFTGSYTVNSNQFCRPNNPPVAVLTASPTSGNAPLTVHFDGSGSYDPDTAPPPDTIASYTFKFGDGTSATCPGNAACTGTGKVDHTYNNIGTYAASLTVTDSRGAESQNAAVVEITVNAPDLIASRLTASNNQAPQGAKIPITATISNIGQVNAGASKTGFLLDGSKSIGLVDTPPVGAQQSVTATLNWNTAGVPKGNHTIQAIADATQVVTESDETNNKSGAITINIQGNKKR